MRLRGRVNQWRLLHGKGPFRMDGLIGDVCA